MQNTQKFFCSRIFTMRRSWIVCLAVEHWNIVVATVSLNNRAEMAKASIDIGWHRINFVDSRSFHFFFLAWNSKRLKMVQFTHIHSPKIVFDVDVHLRACHLRRFMNVSRYFCSLLRKFTIHNSLTICTQTFLPFRPYERASWWNKSNRMKMLLRHAKKKRIL